jgi:hypothetical protein
MDVGYLHSRDTYHTPPKVSDGGDSKTPPLMPNNTLTQPQTLHKFLAANLRKHRS